MASALPLTENHSDGDPAGHVLLHNDVSHYINGAPSAISVAVAAEAALRASGDTAAISTAATDATAKANAAQAAAISTAATDATAKANAAQAAAIADDVAHRQAGLASARSAAATYGRGYWLSTDTRSLDYSDGSSWTTGVGLPAAHFGIQVDANGVPFIDTSGA